MFFTTGYNYFLFFVVVSVCHYLTLLYTLLTVDLFSLDLNHDYKLFNFSINRYKKVGEIKSKNLDLDFF